METFLVCLDSSPRAVHVLAVAHKLASLAGAKMILYRSVGIPPELPSEVLNSDRSVTEILIASATADLKDRADVLPAGAVRDCIVHIATPWDGICRAAKETNADLIVVGSHGYGALDRILGTTAAKVVNHADRSVLVVRPKP